MASIFSAVFGGFLLCALNNEYIACYSLYGCRRYDLIRSFTTLFIGHTEAEPGMWTIRQRTHETTSMSVIYSELILAIKFLCRMTVGKVTDFHCEIACKQGFLSPR